MHNRLELFQACLAAGSHDGCRQFGAVDAAVLGLDVVKCVAYRPDSRAARRIQRMYDGICIVHPEA